MLPVVVLFLFVVPVPLVTHVWQAVVQEWEGGVIIARRVHRVEATNRRKRH